MRALKATKKLYFTAFEAVWLFKICPCFCHAVDPSQEVTQAFVRNVYGHYSGMLTIAAIVMVGVAFSFSFVISKILTRADEMDGCLVEENQAMV